MGELDTAIVVPGVSEAGLIVMEMGDMNEREEGFCTGRDDSDEGLDFAPLGKRKTLNARRRRRKMEKMDASGSF